MADLANDAGTLRLRLALVDRETPVRGPLPVEGGDGRASSGRLLGTAGVELLDRRDGEWWPVLRIAALYLAPAAVQALVGGLQDVLQGNAPGFAWQEGDPPALGVQVGAVEGAEGSILVEVGLDLSVVLADLAEVARRPGAELALFRWTATRAGVVAFAGALRAEAGSLVGDG
jgi:hypothetical protein